MQREARGQTLPGTEVPFDYPDPPPTAANRLPRDFDYTIFSEDQLEYLADFWEDKIHDILVRGYNLLSTNSSSRSRCREIGMNVCIIAKILKLDYQLASADWTALPTLLRCGRKQFFEQKLRLIKNLPRHARNL